MGNHFFRSIRLTASGLALAGALHGCSSPPISLDSPHSFSRIRAIQRASANDDKTAIPRLILLLDSDDPAVRMLSIRTLEHMTGQTLGYDHAGPEPEREHAVDQWETWYLEQTGKTTKEGRQELRRQRALAGDSQKE
ncbi:MAG: HEAT repeat domain-containing protein [Pyrinomonadaceae bacterium]|nr:HEAT repeat domain-containing protein [Phycisphaerales bacterium]